MSPRGKVALLSGGLVAASAVAAALLWYRGGLGEGGDTSTGRDGYPERASARGLAADDAPLRYDAE